MSTIPPQKPNSHHNYHTMFATIINNSSLLYQFVYIALFNTICVILYHSILKLIEFRERHRVAAEWAAADAWANNGTTPQWGTDEDTQWGDWGNEPAKSWEEQEEEQDREALKRHFTKAMKKAKAELYGTEEDQWS